MQRIEISSIKNPRIKNLAALQKSKERKSQGSFIVEGIREVSLAQQGGFDVLSIFSCPEIYKKDDCYPVHFDENVEQFHLTADVFNKIAYRENSGGIIAIAGMKSTALSDLPKKDNPIYLVLEKVEKPGNIGAMLRTADAAGISGVIICDPATDFFNPNVVRSSVGCLFTVPIALTTNSELLSWLRENKISGFATLLTATQPYYKGNYKGSVAFLMGSESDGLSEFWNKNADEKIIIPMQGKIDSMNVSNAAAVVIYEALRQRS